MKTENQKKRTKVVIKDPNYLHAHMIKQITVEAGKYTSDIYINVPGVGTGNAKSLVSLMSVLGRAKVPCHLEIWAEGWDDADKAEQTLKKLLEH